MCLYLIWNISFIVIMIKDGLTRPTVGSSFHSALLMKNSKQLEFITLHRPSERCFIKKAQKNKALCKKPDLNKPNKQNQD